MKDKYEQDVGVGCLSVQVQVVFEKTCDTIGKETMTKIYNEQIVDRENLKG